MGLGDQVDHLQGQKPQLEWVLRLDTTELRVKTVEDGWLEEWMEGGMDGTGPGIMTNVGLNIRK